MSDRRSPSRQPLPEEARLAGVDQVGGAEPAALRPIEPDGAVAVGGISPVLLVLAATLVLLVSLKLAGIHLAAAHRLGAHLGASPLAALSATQLGKVMALAGIALSCSGAIVLALHWPHSCRDRRLAIGCLWLLGPGAVLAVMLDLGPAFWPVEDAAYPLQLAEALVQWLVLGGCTTLIGRRLFGRSPGASNGRRCARRRSGAPAA